MTGVPGPGPGAAEAFGKFQMCEVPASEDEKNGTKQHSIYGLRAFTRANFPSKTAHLPSGRYQGERPPCIACLMNAVLLVPRSKAAVPMASSIAVGSRRVRATVVLFLLFM